MPFDMWLRIFNNYLVVINASGNAWPTSRKRATLLHCLGAEGQRIFYSLPDTGTSFEDAVSALEGHFLPKVNVVVERHTFRQRAQLPHETVNQYLAALRALSANCAFDANTDEMIRDQLLEHLRDDRIRERLLLEPDLTLEKATTLAIQMETAADQANKMKLDGATVHAIQSRPKHEKNKRHSRSLAAAAPPSQCKTCFRCGSDKHLANASQCPAAKVQCKSCGKRGHYARMCRSAPSSGVQEVLLPDVTILYLENSTHTPKRLMCTVSVATPTTPAVPMQLVIDTGSAVSILPRQIYQKHFKDSSLSAAPTKLVSYTRDNIPVIGCLHAQVHMDKTSAAATFFIVEKGTALLGMDLLTALDLRIKGDTVLTSAAVQTPVMSTSVAAPEAPDIGCVKNFVHKVKLNPTITPVRQKLRRLPFAIRDSVSAELDRLLKAGVIERVDASAWVSPIVVTAKKTGGIRMCADLREPNKAVVTDSYPLPHIDELLANLRGAKVFSTIDLANAYYQLPLHEDSRDITAFITHEGLFRFCRVPYGLASAPSAFQKMMATILQGVPGVQNYLDDLIIYGTTPAEHDRSLDTVLLKLREAGLVLNDTKCRFRQTTLRFLGHVITAEGILPDQDHVDAVLNAPPPSDAAALRSFLGLVSWYSKFLPGFATVVAPMRECARDNDSFTWTDAAQNSFEEVKKLLVVSPALSLYDPTLRSVVSTDASDYGLGAVFAQVQPDGTEKPVAFASRTLTATERKYSVVEKEALACVWAVEKWRTYLWGHRFTLRTDHQALTTLLTTKGIGRAGMRVARWSARLLCFDYDMVYRPGSQNYTADCLSRLPLPLPADPSTDVEPDIVAHISSTLSALPVTDFEAACSSCPEMTALRDQIHRGWPPSIRTVNQAMTSYYKVKEELSVKDNFIFRGSRLLVPSTVRQTLISLAHESHQGVVRTKQRLRELYWWPKMDVEVQTCIASCVACQSNDKTATTHPAPLQPTQLPQGPWQKLGLDIVGPFETASPACRYAITLTDYYSKWPELAFSHSATATDVVNFLMSTFSRHGNPECIVTDNGPQFTSAEFAEFMHSHGIHHTRTSVYYPAANGAVERFHRSLKSCLQTAILQSQPWKEAVLSWLQVYRATPHATTSVSPHELLYGRKMRTKLHILPQPSTAPPSSATVRGTVEKNQAKMKRYTDSRRGARAPPFQEGDRVRIRLPRPTPKAHPRFSPPVQVEKQVGPNTFQLSDGKKWNASHLSHVPLGTNVTLRPTCSSTSTSLTHKRTRVKPKWQQDYVVY